MADGPNIRVKRSGQEVYSIRGVMRAEFVRPTADRVGIILLICEDDEVLEIYDQDERGFENLQEMGMLELIPHVRHTDEEGRVESDA